MKTDHFAYKRDILVIKSSSAKAQKFIFLTLELIVCHNFLYHDVDQYVHIKIQSFLRRHELFDRQRSTKQNPLLNQYQLLQT